MLRCLRYRPLTLVTVHPQARDFLFIEYWGRKNELLPTDGLTEPTRDVVFGFL
jgi:hypothetical protein